MQLLLNKAKEYKAFIVNVFFQMFASFLPIAVLQIIVYPRIANTLGGDEYGLMLTIYSIWFLVSSPMSGAICSARLINNEKYNEANLNGDFSIICKKWLLFSTIICFFVIGYYNAKNGIISILLEVIIAVFIFLSDYLECFFRLELNYKDIFIDKLLISIGYIVGYFVYLLTGFWEYVFLIGYGFSVIHCILHIRLDCNNSKTELYLATTRDCKMLLLPSIINGIVSYADKLLLYPLIGGTEVSIYYVATLIGKITSIVAGSFKDVVLSYISKNNINNKNLVAKIMTISAFIVCCAYFVIVIVSNPIINLLYPQWLSEVMVYIPITSMTAMADVMASVIYPFTLKNCDSKWQVVFSLASGLAYFSTSLVLLNAYGLIGFCIGNVIGQVVKIITMIFIYFNKSVDRG